MTVYRRRQCAEGLDANPESVAHYPHVWHAPNGPRWCRGWLPLVSTLRGGIKYPSTGARPD